MDGPAETLVRLAAGETDIIMEVWVDNLMVQWRELENEGMILDLGVNFSDSEQGWYVPRYVIEGDAERGIKASAPNLKNVQGLSRYKQVFADPDDPDRGAFWNCTRAWACEQINTMKLKDYGLEDDFINVVPESAVELERFIVSSYEQGVPFLTYYWSPTWVLGEYDLVRLEEPPYDPLRWFGFMARDRLEQATVYPPVSVHKAANFSLGEATPKLLGFIKHYSFPADTISELLAHGHSRGLKPEELAVHFLSTRPDIWTDWVPEPVKYNIHHALEMGLP